MFDGDAMNAVFSHSPTRRMIARGRRRHNRDERFGVSWRLMRSSFGLSLVVALFAAFAVAEWYESNVLAWRYFFNHAPMAGAFGAAAADLHRETPDEAAEREQLARELRRGMWWSTRVSWASAVLAVLGGIFLSWRAWRTPGHRWLPTTLLSSVTVAVLVLVLVV